MKNLLYIGNNLNQAKSNVSVMATLGPLLEGEGYQMHYASSKKNKLARLLDMLFTVLMSTSKVDLVLLDTYSTKNFYYALIISQFCRFLRLPYIPILHGGNLPNRLTVNPTLSSLIFTHARCNVAPSNYLKEQFESHGYTNLIFIPNTIEIRNYQFIRNRDFTSPKLLWVRSFSKIYNPILAVEVLHLLLKKGYNAELCMVGPDADGSLSKVKAKTIELNVSVTFIGKMKKTDWIELSKNYNVFINTTNFDNMPVSVIESMALGLPVVSTNVGGMPYLIENQIDGLLVPPDTKEIFVEAILKLIGYPEVSERIVLNARQKVEQFDWDKVKFKWLEILA